MAPEPPEFVDPRSVRVGAHLTRACAVSVHDITALNSDSDPMVRISLGGESIEVALIVTSENRGVLHRLAAALVEAHDLLAPEPARLADVTHLRQVTS